MRNSPLIPLASALSLGLVVAGRSNKKSASTTANPAADPANPAAAPAFSTAATLST